jgi:hypothetical protein
MDNALGAWIVTAVMFAGAALLVLLVKHWTGASVAEVLFRWGPREPRPSSSTTRVQTTQDDLAELAELKRISEVFNKTVTDHSEGSDKTVIAHLEQRSDDFEKSAKTSGHARKMFDAGSLAAGSESLKELHMAVAATNRFNTAHSKNLKPRGTLAYTIERSPISRSVNRRSDGQRAREWAARAAHKERRCR